MYRLMFTVALLLAGSLTLNADNKAYIFTGTDQFGTIDLETGAYTQLGNTGVLLAGLGVSEGVIYGGSFDGNTLYAIDPSDGSLSAVGESSVSFHGFGSTTKGLYAIDGSVNLYSVTVTGTATLIGPTGLSLSGTIGMSANSKSLYFTSGDNIYTLNTTTGAPTLLGTTGSSGIGALLFEGGKLYAGSNSPFQVDTINTSTGQGTFVSTPTGNPTPGAFWGLAPSVLLAIAPTRLHFRPQTVGTTSAPQNVTLTNHGFTAMTVKSIVASGDFAQTNTCGTRLAPHQSCTISVTFTPEATGPLTGSVKVSDNADGSAQNIPLSGTGH